MEVLDVSRRKNEVDIKKAKRERERRGWVWERRQKRTLGEGALRCRIQYQTSGKTNGWRPSRHPPVEGRERREERGEGNMRKSEDQR